MGKREEVIKEARSHVKEVVLNLEKGKIESERSLKRSKEIYKTLSEADKIVEGRLMKYNKKRIGEIEFLAEYFYYNASPCRFFWCVI